MGLGKKIRWGLRRRVPSSLGDSEKPSWDKMTSGLPNSTTNTAYEIDVSRFGKIVCYDQSLLFEKREQKGWESGSTLASSLPFFITQLFVANLSYRVIYYLTRPLYLPPFVAQILVRMLHNNDFLGVLLVF